MDLLIAICAVVVTYLLLYKILFEDFDDFIDQLKSGLGWLPLTLLVDYDFSNATWRLWVWLPSGILIGGVLLDFLS